MTSSGDPIVEEVRRRRQDIYDRCGGDFDKFIAQLLEFQEQFRDRLVNQVTVIQSKHPERSDEK